MELLISEIVVRNLYRDVNNAVQKALTVLIGVNILRKKKQPLKNHLLSI